MSNKKAVSPHRSKHRSTGTDAEFNYGPWHVEYLLNDGGRLSRIAFNEYDLLTTEPSGFCPPKHKHGKYEDRPVYGYDDCFPSVVACKFPGAEISIPDHGEVCWLAWQLSKEPDSLTFLVRSKLLPAVFKRKMIFTDSSVVWNFEVLNEGNEVLPFQHSMHPLVRVEDLRWIELPEFGSALDWNRNRIVDSMTREKLRNFLLSLPKGSVEMLFLRDIKSGEMGWQYSNGLSVRTKFPVELFPTIGIWWNNGGYPDEEGIRRNECAFEPTAGNTSVLTQAYADGDCLSVGPGGRFAWQVIWEIRTDLKERNDHALTQY